MKIAEKLGLKKAIQPKLCLVPINQLTANPLQPRKRFENDDIMTLAHSIKENGILQPLCVRLRDDVPKLSLNGQVLSADAVYEIIAGERRWRAAKLAGLEKVPCVIMKADPGDSVKIALAENFYRRDLSFFEEAYAMQNIMIVCGLNQSELATSLGISQPTVANKLRLLRFSDEERRIISDCGFPERLCRVFLRVENENARNRLLKSAEAHRWTAEECETKVEQYLNGIRLQEKSKTKGAPHKITGALSDIRFIINSVDKAIGLATAAGFDIKRNDSDMGDYYELRLLIPKVRKKCQ